MTSPHDHGGTGELAISPRVWIGIVAAFAVLIVIVMAINIFGGNKEESTPTDTDTPSTNAPNVGDGPVRTEAKPSFRMEEIEGCTTPAQDDVDTLVGTLKDGGTVELSTAWKGNVDGENRSAIALMVRSEQGTINQPHLVWMDIDGKWKAVTRGTVEESDAEDDLSYAADSAVGAAIQCLTAGSR